jgi:hypothetical protein
VLKFAPRTIEGLFLGIHLQPGLRYRGEVTVVELQPLREGLQPRIRRVLQGEVRFPQETTFPIHEAREVLKLQNTVDHLRASGPGLAPIENYEDGSGVATHGLAPTDGANSAAEVGGSGATVDDDDDDADNDDEEITRI